MNSRQRLHLAIIPDGNRRWAKKRILKPWQGHEQAVNTIRSITDWCQNHEDIDVLTFWLFSTENWKRDAMEIEKLMGLLEKYLKEEQEEFHAKQTQFVHSGRRDRLPKSLVSLIETLEEETKEYTNFTLHLAIDYGGKDEILRAASRLHSTKTDEESFRNVLDHPELPDIDIIIRTSGEMRTSNFFLWQSTYAEWFFLDVLFPDLEEKDIEQALEKFSKRERRFGGSK